MIKALVWILIMSSNGTTVREFGNFAYKEDCEKVAAAIKRTSMYASFDCIQVTKVLTKVEE
jgi:hypothetical protein